MEEKKTLKAVDRILEECNVDVIDQILLHFPAPANNLPYSNSKIGSYKQSRIDSWRALETRYKEGKIRTIGVSNYMPSHLQDLIDNCEIIPAVNQIEIHPILTREKTRAYCKTHGIAIVGYSPLAKGLIFKNPTLESMAQKYNKSIAQIAIRWALQHEIISIPKSVHAFRIKENSNVFDFRISVKDMKTIDNLNNDLHAAWIPDNIP